MIALVYNPAAGGGRVAANWSTMERTIRAAFGEVRAYPTAARGDGITQARAAVEAGATTVLSLGGDGTHNEVTNGIMQAGAPAGTITLGVLHAGTGGDFRRLLAHGDSLESSIAALPTATSTPIDIGAIQFKADSGAEAGSMVERYFLNIASFGIAGLIDRKVNQSSKRLGGTPTFLLSTISALIVYKPPKVRLSVDGREVGTYTITNIAVCNGRFFGGGMMVSPHSKLTDGRLDIIVLEDRPLLQAARGLKLIYEGAHLKEAGTHVFQGTTASVEPMDERVAWVDIDGEAPGVIPASFRVLPGAIRLLDARPDVQ